MLLQKYQKLLEKFSTNTTRYLLLTYASINIILFFIIIISLLYLFKQKNTLETYSQILNNERINISKYKEISINLAKDVNYYKSYKALESQNDSLLIDGINKSLLSVSEIKSNHNLRKIHFIELIDALESDFSNLGKENKLLLDYLTQLGNEESGLYYKMLNSVKDFMYKYKSVQEQAESIKGIEQILYSIQLLNKIREESIILDVQSRFDLIFEQMNPIAADSNNYMTIRVSDALQNVNNAFQEYARKSFEIGINKDKGLLQKIIERCSKIEYRLIESQELINETKFQRNLLSFVFIVLIVFIFLSFNILTIYFFFKREKLTRDLFEEYVTKLAEGKALDFKERQTPPEITQFIEKLEKFSSKFLNAKKCLLSLSKDGVILIEKDNHFAHFYGLFNQIKELNENLHKQIAEEKKLRDEMLWTKKGIDRLTEVMRRQYDNPLLHANEIINMLVDYLKIPIGAIYLVKIENEVKYVEMVSAFAYGKEKQMYRKIAFGEGIIGTAASERKTMNISNIPENYFNIVSGFGESKPKNILVCPIKLNEELYGVIELSSLSRFKNEEINFIEEVCKTIAFSFAISKVYIDTLTQFENSHLQIAELEAENESLLNDYNDLNNNYKSLSVISSDNEFIISRLNEIAYTAVLDLDGNIIQVNQKLEQLFKSDRKKFIQTNYRDYMASVKFKEDIDFDYIWRDVRAGIQQDMEFGIMIANQEFWLKQYLYPVKDELGRVRKILMLAFNVTDKVRLENELAGLKAG